MRVERSVGFRLSGRDRAQAAGLPGSAAPPSWAAARASSSCAAPGGWRTAAAASPTRRVRPVPSALSPGRPAPGRAALLAGRQLRGRPPDGPRRPRAGPRLRLRRGRRQPRSRSARARAGSRSRGPAIRRGLSVAVRDLATLEVVRSGPAAAPSPGARPRPRGFPLHCADADGASVHVAVGDYVRRTRFDRMKIFRVDAAGAHRSRPPRAAPRRSGRDRLRRPLQYSRRSSPSTSRPARPRG